MVTSESTSAQCFQDSTECLAKATTIQPSEYAWYEIKSSGEGRGLGVFALKAIPQGTRILSETPQFTVDFSMYTRQEIRAGLEAKRQIEEGSSSTNDMNALKIAQVRRTIMEAFSKLNEEEQASALSLHCENGDGSKEDIILILKANGFNHGHNGAALCVSSSRFNHACVPNAHFGWNSRIGQQTFQIIKPGGLKKGEEILVCYDEPEALFAIRQKHLLKTYGFQCECTICGVGRKREVSERRRKEIKLLMDRVKEFERLPYEVGLMYGIKDPLIWILRVRDLLIEDGLVGLCLARCLRKAGEWYVKSGKMKKAKEIAEEERKIVKYCLGEDHGKMAEIQKWITDL